MSAVFTGGANQAFTATLADGPLETDWKLVTFWGKIPTGTTLGSTNVAFHLGDTVAAPTNGNVYIGAASSTVPAFNYRAANGTGTLSGGAIAIPYDTWNFYAVLLGPNIGAGATPVRIYFGNDQIHAGTINGTTVASRRLQYLRIGSYLADNGGRWRGKLSKLAIFAPASGEDADAIVASLRRYTIDSVPWDPLWYAPLEDDASVAVGHVDATLTNAGSATFDGADEPSALPSYPGNLVLRTTGIASKASFVVAVDNDGQIKEFVSSSVNADMATTNVTTGISTWKGADAPYFETTSINTIVFGTNKPVQNAAFGQSIGAFIAHIGTSAATGSYGGLRLSGAGAIVTRDPTTGKPQWRWGQSNVRYTSNGANTLPTDGTTKYSLGGNYRYDTSAQFFYGLESGSLAAEGTPASPEGFGSSSTWITIGGQTSGGYGTTPGKYLLAAGFGEELTEVEYQALHDDPYNLFYLSGDAEVVTIGTGGTRDYTSIQAAWNALPSTFANDYIFECYNDGMLAGLNLASSSKTMGSFTLTIRPAAGQGFADHASSATNPLWFNQTKGVAFEVSAFLSQVFDLSTAGNAIYLSGLQIRNSHSGRAVLGTANLPVYADNCILEGAAGAGNNGEVFQFGGVTNCLVVTRSTDGDGIVGDAFHYWRNNTVVAPNGSTGRGLRHEFPFTNLVAGNAVFGFATAFQGSNWSGSSSHNATDTGTTVGSSGLTSLTFASQFVSVTNDFRVKSGSSLINAGVYHADIDPDIAGKTRHATTPTIGAWEFVDSEPLEPWPLIVDGETLSTVLARINALDDQLTPLADGVTFGQIRARINELNTGLTPLTDGASFLTVRNRINELIQLRNEGG
jgi:hypothetical protein